MTRYLLLLALVIQSAFAQTDAKDSWKPFEFLTGKWTGVAGEKDTPLGAGLGSFTFEFQLQKKILVRRNDAVYVSGQRHDDLMIVYVEDTKPYAIYFDSEGHVIRYSATVPAPGSVVFESDPSQPGPRYRLSYELRKVMLDGKFEIAPPGAPFKQYLKWTAKRD